MKGKAPTNKELAARLRKMADITRNEQVEHILRLSADRLEKKGHTQNEQRAAVLYTVLDSKRGDQCIAFELPGKECAERMGITYNAFMAAIRRGSNRWTIQKRFADEKYPEEL